MHRYKLTVLLLSANVHLLRHDTIGPSPGSRLYDVQAWSRLCNQLKITHHHHHLLAQNKINSTRLTWPGV